MSAGGPYGAAEPAQTPLRARPPAALNALRTHLRITGALILREMYTRFGRRNLGFAWIIAEPLLFIVALVALWTIVRPGAYHNLPVAAFVYTGYTCLLVFRHALSRGINCISQNHSLLYHRQVRLIHLFFGRWALEAASLTIAASLVGAVIWALGLSDPPQDLARLYAGWCMANLFGLSLMIFFGALSELSDVFEKLTNILSYLMIPLSGAFFMLHWLPEAAREALLMVPMISIVELFRAGYFGEEVETYYRIPYVLFCTLGLGTLGLFLLRFVPSRLDP